MADLTRVKALLVGAGAVGQVFGRHLADAGVQVAYFVKPKYRESAEEGFTLHRLKTFGKRPPVNFSDYDVYCSPAEWRGARFDQVWLCISSPAMRSAWLDEFLPSIQGATLISLQPGFDDRAYLEQRYPAELLVSGMIGFVAYQAPLEGEELWPKGVAYWLPPLSPSPFCGPEERATAVVNTLQQGKLPAAYRPDTLRQGALASAILMPSIVALEEAGWELERLRTGGMIELLAACLDESIQIACAHHGTSRGIVLKLLAHERLLRAGIWTAPRVTPFDLQTYLRYHFSKVREQTRQQMEELISLGVLHDLPVARLRELTRMWDQTLGAGDLPRELPSLEEQTDSSEADATSDEEPPPVRFG